MLKVTTSPHLQPEKAYAFHVILHELLGIAYQLEFQSISEHRLQLPNGAIYSIPDGFLSLPQYPAQDLVAASFFLLTRLEEQGPKQLDLHGRFPAEQSLAYRNGTLDRPVIHEWADELWQQLLQLGWKGERKRPEFRLSFSCDVDHPRLWWSNVGKLKTLAGALLKRGDLGEAGYWMRNYLFHSQDPYDVFEEWLNVLEDKQRIGQFNFMGKRPRSSDCWYPIEHPFIRNLIRKIAERGHQIGFHPSYEAFEREDLFLQELASLQELSPVPIRAGRQHYLRFSTPKTWQIWESAGLKEDSTLGYPEAEGFRCGMCQDFPVFDTQQRKMLSLREKPLIAMDITLAQYRNYTPEQAAEKLAQLRKQVEKHGGDFTLLWHNSSWNTPFWEPWKAVFLDFIAQ